ncbi:MAG: uroporphyrinogen-III synthase [Paracoccaceae bacterium]
MTDSPAPTPVPVLITRPQPQADRLAQALDSAMPGKVRPVLAPLMRAVFLPVDLPPGRFDALILTSETGAEAAGRLRAAGAVLPDTLFCVGPRTARAALAHGFQPKAPAMTAKDLLQRLVLTGGAGRMLYLHGRDVSSPLADRLAQAGIPAEARAVYAQEPLALPPQALALLQQPGPVVVPLYSPRSARLFQAALPAGTRADLRPCAISDSALSALSEPLSARGVVAEAPDGPAMMRAILRVILSLSP